MSEILLVAEHRQGQLRPVSLELVTAAQSAKRSVSDRVTLALLAAEPEAFLPAASVAGIDEIVSVRMPVPELEPELFEAALSLLIAARCPAVVLLAHSVDSMSYAPALAARGGFGFASDVFRIEQTASGLVATRSGYAQKVNVEVDFPDAAVIVLTVRTGVFKAAEGGSQPLMSEAPAPALQPRCRSLRFIEASSADDVDMASVPFILSIGRGIGEASNVQRFRELAAKIGATLGCSRPVADAGWLAKSRQIGQSGKTASACKLYLAMGISGAIQHLAGMKHIGTIVAVNSDPGASIFSVAHYGIVGDIFDVADALERHFS